MIDLITELFSNQFLSGGLALMVMGTVLYNLRFVGQKFLQWLWRQATISLEIRNDDPAFEWVETWLDANPYSKKSRRMTLSTMRNDREDKNFSYVMTPAPGNHFFLYRDRLVWLNRERGDSGGGNASSSGASAESIFGLKPREAFHFTLLGRSQKAMRLLIDDIQLTAKSRMRNEPAFYVATYGYWSKRGDIIKKSIESVVLPGNLTETVFEDAKWFFGARDWYAERGIPYRRGYLLHGMPGSGKSSLVMALANELDVHLYMFNISSHNMSDDRLYELMNNIENNSIILFEDIDIVTPGRKQKRDKDGITLTGLLNVLDGPAAREGCAVFMTTNYKKTLDAALIRAGRADLHVEFTHATPNQAYKLFERFYGRQSNVDSQSFAALSNGTKMCMADVQQLLISHKDDPRKMIKQLQELPKCVTSGAEKND